MQLGKLVLRQSLGGEEIQRARVRVFEHCIENWQVVAESLARGRRGHHDRIAPGVNGCHSGGLMAIEFANTFLTVDCGKLRTNPIRHRRKLRLPRRDMAHGGQHLARAVACGQLFDDLANTGRRDRVPCVPHGQRFKPFVPLALIRLLFAYANMPVRTAQRPFSRICRWTTLSGGVVI